MASNITLLCQGNASAGNSTSDLWLVEDRVTGQVTAAFLLLIVVVGLPWNLLVVIIIVKEKLYRQPTVILLLNLAINDIIWIIFLLPLQMVAGFAGEFIFGSTDSVRCLFCGTGASNLIFSLISVYTIAIMAFDRFLYIYKPLRYDKIITSKRIFIVLVNMWIALVLLAVFPLFGLRVIFYSPFLYCVPDLSLHNIGHLTCVVVLSVIPIIILLVCNVWVAIIVQRNIRAIYNARRTLSNDDEHKSHKTVKKKRSQKQLHLFQVFGALLCSSLWSPGCQCSA